MRSAGTSSRYRTDRRPVGIKDHNRHMGVCDPCVHQTDRFMAVTCGRTEWSVFSEGPERVQARCRQDATYAISHHHWSGARIHAFGPSVHGPDKLSGHCVVGSPKGWGNPVSSRRPTICTILVMRRTTVIEVALDLAASFGACGDEPVAASNWRRDRANGHSDVSGDRGIRSRVPGNNPIIWPVWR